MSDTEKAPASPVSEAFTATFAPMYYNSPVNQRVLGFDLTADDSLTAAIKAGAQYFKVTAIDVCNWVTDPIVRPPRVPPGELPIRPGGEPITPVLPQPPITVPQRHLSAPVASANGITPLAVKQGQYARLWVTAEVPKGSALPAGNFTGVVVLSGKSLTRNGSLTASYLGKLIEKVVVQPESVAPGQPALVQVCDATGKPVSDATVSVVIQGVPTSSRYLQYATTGTRTLMISAGRGALSETAQATIAVTGTPLAFRQSLTAPVVTSLPMLQSAPVPGQPYAVTFRLGTPAALRQTLALAVAKADAAHPGPAVIAATATATAPVVPADPLGAEVSKAIAVLPGDRILKFAPQTVKAATNTTIASGAVALLGELQTRPEATSYQWEFGDGQTATTQAPTVTHDYFSAIQAGKIAHSFDVTCRAVHDNVTVKRTIVLHSAYGLCRRNGVIVPYVTGNTYAIFMDIAFCASLIVHNIEAAPITLNSMAIVPVSDDTSVVTPAPQFTAMQSPVVVPAKSASAIGVYVSLPQLRAFAAPVAGFVIYYSGSVLSAGGTTPVRFSYMFRISLADGRLTGLALPAPTIPIVWPIQFNPSNWDIASALQAVTGIVTQPSAAVSKAGEQVIDPATKTVAIALSADAQAVTTQAQAHTAVQAGLTGIALKSGAIKTTGPQVRLLTPAVRPPTQPIVADDITFDPLNPPPVVAGNECYPDDISDADAATAAAQQLVCQLTTITKQETFPSSFQNAQAGDVILSPAPVGGGDLIAAMFRALTPPQHHGHSGIMTANFYEITHCTASVDRLTANVNKDSLGIPTSLNGNMLQYAWPGSLTQSVDDAINSMPFKDPSGATYTLTSFNTDSEGEGFEIIPPLVIKPLPENEPKVRPTLRKVADTARSKGARYDANGNMTQKGGCYYSFYAYTDPQLSAGFTDAGGVDAGWAQGLSPAVCSSFVWLSAKANNIPLVTSNTIEKLSDFSAQAVAGGVQVGSETLDGLLYYPQSDRQQAAQGLYQMFMDQALSQEDGLGTLPGINETIAGPIADQLLNDFAFGNPNMVGSSNWKNPGEGNAVSPDNIIWWNPPFYGYAEPLQYLPKHVEQYTVSRWVKVVTWGAIKGTVRANGQPVANAHVWVYLPGGDAYTAADGSFTLNRVPIGTYALKAQGVIIINGVAAEFTNGGGLTVTLTAANPNVVENIVLQGAPQNYRRADVTYSISCDHGDANPFNTHGVQTAGPFTRSTTVNPGQVTNSLGYSYDYNGGGYFHIDYNFSVVLVQDMSLEVTVVGTMYNDGTSGAVTQYTCGPFNVPMGQTWSGYLNLEYSNGYHNGPANFTFSVTNNQQTG